MKKEILIAIIVGFAGGLLITFGLYTARQTFQSKNQIQSPLAEEKTKEASLYPQEIQTTLAIVSPGDESISKESKIPLVGVTSPSSWLVILTEKGEKLLQADSKGSFETEISLISGENEIEVQAHTEKGEKVSKTITVVYSTAEI